MAFGFTLQSDGTKGSRFLCSAIAVVAYLVWAPASMASPIVTPPLGLDAVGDVTAIYVYADAMNTSVLSEVTPRAIEKMFCNHDQPGCAAGVAGDTMDLGLQDGPMEFRLDNVSSGTTFLSDLADPAGDYHVKISSDYADFGVGALPPAASSIVLANLAMGRYVTYVGWEDMNTLQGSDFDYNDLIFAFVNVRPVRVPEPMSLALALAGLGGLRALRRMRKA